ncbi:MAG TPA: glutathione S-transferase family protein [Casimicrobiaceae bacterium]|nr:glutathione S-transferase family protein [Casimicrobiaceae bacterium]
MKRMTERNSRYVLYGTQGSGAAAIEAALDLCGARWKLVGRKGDARRPALKTLNPLNLVPTLELPDGSVMTESAAILMHLADAYPASGLMPRKSAARAQTQRGLVYIAANCYSAIGIIDFPKRWCAPCDDETAERIRAGTRKKLHRNWEIFADTFADDAHPYLGGQRLSALDLLAVVVSRWSGTRQHLKAARPAFHDTLQSIEQHPKVVPVFERHWP